MNPVVLYLVLLKATLTTFSGLASLPLLRQDLVVSRHAMTDDQLNAAVVVSRATPGPVGLYVVSVGYFAGGVPGAVAGWLALCTPALAILPLIHFAGKRADHPRTRSAIRAVVLAGTGLLWAAAASIANATIGEPLLLVILLVSAVLLATGKIANFWVVLAGALARVLAG